MQKNKFKIVLTRTVPIDDFFKLLNFIKKKHPNSEIILLLQKNLNKNELNLNEYKSFQIETGSFSYNVFKKENLNKLIYEEIDLFIIASNNSNFKGYNEFIKLSRSCKAVKTELITKNIEIKKINKLFYYLQDEQRLYKKIFRPFLNCFLNMTIMIKIIYYVLLMPFIWFKKKRKIIDIS